MRCLAHLETSTERAKCKALSIRQHEKDSGERHDVSGNPPDLRDKHRPAVQTLQRRQP
jgi:hypothetical protein